MRGTPGWPDNVYQVERVLLQSFAKNGELCNAFYCNDDFCQKFLDQAAYTVETGVFKDAPTHMKLKIDNPNWTDSFLNKTTTAAAEVLQQLSQARDTTQR